MMFMQMVPVTSTGHRTAKPVNIPELHAEDNWYYAKDTLTFQNRIRDDIDEWQYENPANYK